MSKRAPKHRRSTFKKDALNLPNLITMGRVAIIPVVLWLLARGEPRDCVLAALVYAAAAISDLVDGYLARRMNIVSVLGKFLDPLADKLLVMASLIWMVHLGRMATWVVVLILARELAITGLRSIASSEGLIIASARGGKFKTAFQMAGILCLIIGYPYNFSMGPYDFGRIDLVPVGRVLVYVSLVFSLTSAFEYIVFFGRALEKRDTV